MATTADIRRELEKLSKEELIGLLINIYCDVEKVESGIKSQLEHGLVQLECIKRDIWQKND